MKILKKTLSLTLAAVMLFSCAAMAADSRTEVVGPNPGQVFEGQDGNNYEIQFDEVSDEVPALTDDEMTNLSGGADNQTVVWTGDPTLYNTETGEPLHDDDFDEVMGGSISVQMDVSSLNLKPGQTVYVYQYNAKNGKWELVKATLSADGRTLIMHLTHVGALSFSVVNTNGGGSTGGVEDDDDGGNGGSGNGSNGGSGSGNGSTGSKSPKTGAELFK